MHLIAQSFDSLRAPASPAPAAHAFGVGAGIERDASGIWVNADLSGVGTTDRLIRPYEQHATVFKAVNQIARNLSGVKLEFFAGDSDTPLPATDPVVRLFSNPEQRAGVRQRQFISRYAQDMDLSGDWFLVLDGIARTGRRGGQLPTLLRRVSRHKMRPRVDRATGDLLAWDYVSPGKSQTFAIEQVVHSFYPSPYDDYMGIAPLAAAMVEADSDYQAALWNRYFFENDTSSGLVFTRDKDSIANRTKDEQFLDYWRKIRQGVTRAHQPILAPPGVDVTEIGASQKDMGFTDLRRFSREQILSIFDVPPAIAGVFEYANYANAREQLRYFWYHKLFPMMDELESVIQADILDRFNTGVRCAFKREEVQALIDDFSTKLEGATKLWGMGLPFAAINDRMELGFDTDEIEGTDVGFLPFSVAPVASVMDPPEPVAPTQPAPGQVPEDDDPALDNRLTHAKGRASRWRSYQRMTTGLERRMLGDWRGFQKWLGESTITSMRNANMGGEPRVTHDDEARWLPDEDETEAQAVKRTASTRGATYKRGYESGYADIGASVDFRLLDRKVLRANQERQVFIKTAAANERERLRLKIEAGIVEGSSIDDIEATIRQHMREGAEGWARTVARTETLSAFSRARFDSFGEAGIERHEWLSAQDDVVRDSHSAIDGEVRRMGDAFSNGLSYPHQWNGPPEEVINCRCDVLPVIA